MAVILPDCFDRNGWWCGFSITLNAIFIIDLAIAVYAIWNLYMLRNSLEISKHRFISLTIVCAELVVCITHYLFDSSKMMLIAFEMIENLIKYCGFYYSIYFFSSNAVEILANKENEFMYYTKLGLRSTLFIQIVHCSSTFILLVISPNTNDYDQFCKNNVWVMMRFLALAVTIGFIFIGWQIQQSILNPLLSQQKRKNIIENRKKKDPNKQSIKIKFSKSVDDEPMYIDKKGSSSISDDSSASVISNNPSRITIETEEFISMKIKVKRKQLRLMWYIQFSILFVCLFDMLFSGIQFLFNSIRDCYSMTEVDMLDSLFYFITKFVGLILWTLPVIYVYWGREFYLAIKARRGDMADDEDDEEIDKYFEERPNERSQGIIKKSDNALVIKNRESKSQISSLT